MKTKNQKGVFKITPGLELNTSTLETAAAQLVKALQKADAAKSVEIDLSQTSAFDSGTVKILLALAQECKTRELTLQIQASKEAKQFLNLFHLQRRMSIITQEEAE
jgi:anti-anti-sigma factor